MNIDATTMIRRAGDLVASEIDGEYLIMSIERGSYISIRDVSARIWELLQEPRSLGSLHETLLDEYVVDEETCKAEVSALLRHMAGCRIISLEQPA